jgi:integrase
VNAQFEKWIGSPDSFWKTSAPWYRRQWAPLRKKAGLLRTVRLHDLRHTAAALLLGSGVDVRTVSGILGHAPPSITLDVYSLDPEQRRGRDGDPRSRTFAGGIFLMAAN